MSPVLTAGIRIRPTARSLRSSRISTSRPVSTPPASPTTPATSRSRMAALPTTAPYSAWRGFPGIIPGNPRHALYGAVVGNAAMRDRDVAGVVGEAGGVETGRLVEILEDLSDRAVGRIR